MLTLPQRVRLVDPATGLIDREWLGALNQLQSIAPVSAPGGNADVTARVSALEAANVAQSVRVAAVETVNAAQADQITLLRRARQGYQS